MKILFVYMARWKAVNWSRYHQILTCLAESGHEVHVLQPPPQQTPETNFQEIETETPATLYLHDVEIPSWIWNRKFPLNKLVKKGIYSIACKNQAKRLIDEHKIDVMLLYNIPQYSLTGLDNCIKVFDVADDYLAMLKYELGKLSNPVVMGIAKLILYKMMHRCEVVTTVSETLVQKFDKHGDMVVIPNGAKPNKYPIGCGSKLKQRYGSPLVGFVGAFEYFIDFDVILKAAQKLPQVKFLLVGSGRKLPLVKKAVEEMRLHNVILTGAVPYYKVPKYIDAMDVCLNIFTKDEVSQSACPIKLFEYLVMRKPVISTPLEELKSIDDNFLFYASDSNELVGHISGLLNGKPASQKIIDSGYSCVEQKYNWNFIAKRFTSVIEETQKGISHEHLPSVTPWIYQTLYVSSSAPRLESDLKRAVEFRQKYFSRLSKHSPEFISDCGTSMFNTVKRGLDIIGALIGLGAFAVLFPLLALAIKLDSRGPIFFGQERIGFDRRKKERRTQTPPANLNGRSRIRRYKALPGQPFTIYKLRTMYLDAETATGAVWAKSDDPRITRVGKLLRKLHLDELPQLWNVLKGEMSLVGPRPERTEFVHCFNSNIPGYGYRQRVRPGITGLAQVRNGYDTRPEDVIRKLQYDLLYIKKMCLWTDMQIVFETAQVILKGRKEKVRPMPMNVSKESA